MQNDNHFRNAKIFEKLSISFENQKFLFPTWWIFLDDEFFFLQRGEKISTYAPKSWSGSEKRNFKVHDPFVLHLKIQYFVVTPSLQLLDYGSRKSFECVYLIAHAKYLRENACEILLTQNSLKDIIII